MSEEPAQGEVLLIARQVLEHEVVLPENEFDRQLVLAMLEEERILARAVLALSSRAHEAELSLLRIRQILDGRVVSLITREGSE